MAKQSAPSLMPTHNPAPLSHRIPLRALGDRNRLNFHEEFRTEETLNLNSSAGRRILHVHELVANLSERSQMRGRQIH
jgi:hypothetical protein